MAIIAETAHLQRIYYDASHWNRLHDHAEREKIVDSFDRRKRAVFPSVVNAAELLNTPDPGVRESLCALMAAFQDESHSVLDHPEHVLMAAAEGWRKGTGHLTLTESKAARAFRDLVKNPGRLDGEGQKDAAGWTAALKKDNAEFRKELGEILGEKGFAGNAEELTKRKDFAALLYSKVPEVTRTATSGDEVFELVQRTSVWAAYAAAVAYEFHLANQDLTKKERKKLPGGPDMRQLAYIGLVNRFIVRDPGLFRAARWVAGHLPEGSVVDVLESDDYFARVGYPFVPRRT